MRRRLLLCVAAVGLIAAGAIAVPLPTMYEIPPLNDANGTETDSVGRAITPDGRYVAVASTAGSPTAGAGAIWDVANGTRRVRDVPGNLSEDATGIGYFTESGDQRLVVHAAASGPRDCYWISADGGATFGRHKPGATTGFDSNTANTLAGSGSGNTFYGAYNSANDQLEGIRGTGDPPSWLHSNKGTPTKSSVKSVASSSPVSGREWRAVGWRRDSSGNEQNYVLDYDGTTAAPANWYPYGLKGNREGELWAIAADDGDRVGGRSPHSTKTGLWPFIIDNPVADGGTATELPTFTPTASYASNAIVYGISPDGDYAVGMDYTKTGAERAVLWDLSDPDPGNWSELDLSDFATTYGLLGNFGTSGPLRRAYAVAVNDQGQPVITGRGVAWDPDLQNWYYRGFVLTVPEPATLSLLTLGVLPLLCLRRRRR